MDDHLFMATTPNPLAGKVVLVTGAVGNLGSATAQALQGAGAKTVLIDRSNDRLREQFPGLVDSPEHFSSAVWT
jgi:NAD(P)-dependent dehydrogenase (short-subunit alcohol dehydrogenase family)